MATLREAINIAKTEPTSQRSMQLMAAIHAGTMDKVAADEGLDLSTFKKATAPHIVNNATDMKHALIQKAASFLSNPGQAIEGKALDITRNAAPAVMKSAIEYGKTIGPEEAAADIEASKQRETTRQQQTARQQAAAQKAAKFGQILPATVPKQGSTTGETLTPGSEEYIQAKEGMASQLETENLNRMNPFGGVGVGIAKGAASTAFNMAKLGKSGLDALGNVVGIKSSDGYNQASENISNTVNSALEPKGIEQQVGKVMEQGAEFALPMGGISKAGKAAELAAGTGKYLPTIAKVGTEALLGGAAAGAQTAMQEGELNSNAAISAGVSTALPVVGAALKGIGTLIKNNKVKLAGNEIAKLIKPDKNAYLFGKDPAQAVAKEGIIANSWDDLTSKITAVKNKAGATIDDIVTNANTFNPQTVDVSNLIKKNVKDFAKKNVDTVTQKTYIQKIQDLINKSVPDIKTGQVKIVGQVPLDNMNAKDLWNLQKKIGKLTKWTNQAGENEANKQLHQLYRAIGEQLEALAPGTKAAQFKYAEFLGAEKAAMARAAVATRNTNSLVGAVGASAGLGLASATGGKPEDYIKNVAIGVLGPAFVRSPFFKTRFASILAKESGISTGGVTKVLDAFVKYGSGHLDAK